MNFQEAIEIVLAGSPKPMTSYEIAMSINERGIFYEWKGKPVDANLVYGRANQHQDKFSIVGNLIKLKNEASKANDALRIFRNIVSHTNLPRFEIIIPFLVFWGRVTTSKKEISQRYFDRYTFHTFFESDMYKSDGVFLAEAVSCFIKNLNDQNNIKFDTFSNEFYSSKSYLYVVEAIQYSGILNISDTEFYHFYNDLIKGFGLQTGLRGHSTTNDLIGQIITKIVADYEFQSLYDPFAGSAGLITSVVKNKRTSIELDEINNDVALLGWMTMILNDFQDFKVTVKDSFNYNKIESFDLIVTEPPFNVKQDFTAYNYPIENVLFRKSNDFIANVIQLILNKLSDNGKAVFVLPESFLTSGGERATIRHYLVYFDLINSIVALPVNTYKPYTSIKTCLIVLDKNKSNDKKGRILFQDFSEKSLEINKLISITQNWDNLPNNAIVIQNSDFDKYDNKTQYYLDVRRFTNSLKFNENHKVLGSLLKEKTQSGSYNNDKNAIKKEFAVEKNSIPFITIKDLSDSASDYVLNPDKAEKHLPLTDDNQLLKGIIDREAILISKIGNKLKPTYFEGNKSIIISANILALFPDTSKVLSEYLIAQLNEDYVIEQIEQIRVGSVQTFLRLQDFLLIKIKVEDLTKQEILLGEYYKQKLSKTELIFTDEVKKTEEFEIQLLASLQHELRGQILQPLSTEIDNLKNYLNRKSNEPNKFSWDDKISSAPKSRKVSDLFTRLDDVIGTAKMLFDNMQKVIELDKDKLKKTKVNILNFLKDEVDKFSEELKDFHITYSFFFRERPSIYIDIDKNSFSNVISNFIRNSIQHGFDPTAKERHLAFNVSKDEYSSEIIIDLLDNGKGFPEGFNFKDFITYKIKSNNSTGSGIGGYLLYRTVEIHEGGLENLDKGKIIYVPSQNNYPFTKRNINKESDIGQIGIKTGVHFRITLPNKTT